MRKTGRLPDTWLAHLAIQVRRSPDYALRVICVFLRFARALATRFSRSIRNATYESHPGRVPLLLPCRFPPGSLLPARQLRLLTPSCVPEEPLLLGRNKFIFLVNHPLWGRLAVVSGLPSSLIWPSVFSHSGSSSSSSLSASFYSFREGADQFTRRTGYFIRKLPRNAFFVSNYPAKTAIFQGVLGNRKSGNDR